MLHRLSRRDDARIRNLPALERLQDLLALLDDALNGLARDTLGPLTHDLEHLLEALYLLLGFLQVHSQSALQLLGLGCFRHLRQGFENGVLGEVGVLELVNEEGLEVFLSHGVVSWLVSAGPTQHSGTRARSELLMASRAANSRLNPDSPVRPDGAVYQWRKVPPSELSVELVADERLGWATDRAEAS